MKILLAIFLVVVNGCHSRIIHEDIDPVIHGKVLLGVFLVRHAESKKNVVHAPWTPEKELDTLTAEGQRQAVAIGNFLNDKGIVAILSSPAGRTRETAQSIGQVIGLKEGYKIDPAFASFSGGKNQDGDQVSWAWREKQWDWDRIHVLKEESLYQMGSSVLKVA